MDRSVRGTVLRGVPSTRRRGSTAAARFPLSYDIVRSAGAEVEEVHARGTSSLARLMSLIVVGDLTSVYLAIVPMASIPRPFR